MPGTVGLRIDPNSNRIQDTRRLTETQGSSGGSSILDAIVETKREEVARLRGWASAFRARARDAPEPRDFAGAIRGTDTVSLMTEVKRRSPGAGIIREGLNAAGLAASYREAGAAAVSVLTDREYFDGSLEDLRAVREAVDIPVLRKDFVLDEVQVHEARAAGADAILLIVRILDDGRLRDLREAAEALGMAALTEVHGLAELGRALDSGASLVGINNRDLGTFETRLEVTLELLPGIPPGVTVVSESGIRTPGDVDRLGAAGVHAVLVGESLLRAPDPGAAAAELARRERVDKGDDSNAET